MSSRMVKKIQDVRYHRNGSAGTGFHVVRFVDKGRRVMVACVFPWRGVISVLDVDNTSETWSGWEFEPEMREAVAAYEQGRGAEAEEVESLREGLSAPA